MTTLRVGAIHRDHKAAARDNRARWIFTHAWHDDDGNLRVDRHGSYDADQLEAERARLLGTLDQTGAAA
jgi:hypothetical protein